MRGAARAGSSACGEQRVRGAAEGGGEQRGAHLRNLRAFGLLLPDFRLDVEVRVRHNHEEEVDDEKGAKETHQDEEDRRGDRVVDLRVVHRLRPPLERDRLRERNGVAHVAS